MENCLVMDSGEFAAARNMATDAALLELAGELGHPVLRHYGWSEPAATFGYFQQFAQVAEETELRPLIRRPTGGGLVPHDRDWTYCLVLPAGHAWHGCRARESYRRIHDWVRAGLLACGLDAALAGSAREGAGACFAGNELDDVMFGGRKIAGAAQRRNRQGLLIQGSIQPSPEMRREDWRRGAAEALREVLSWEPVPLPERLDLMIGERTEELLASTYGRPEFHRRR